MPTGALSESFVQVLDAAAREQEAKQAPPKPNTYPPPYTGPGSSTPRPCAPLSLRHSPIHALLDQSVHERRRNAEEKKSGKGRAVI